MLLRAPPVLHNTVTEKVEKRKGTLWSRLQVTCAGDSHLDPASPDSGTFAVSIRIWISEDNMEEVYKKIFPTDYA